MDAQQRRRAGRAVAAEMDAQGMTLQGLSDDSGVAVTTIRDRCNGKRWPWTQKRNDIEAALGWDTGTIAAIAKGNGGNGNGNGDLADMPVEEALTELLERSPLSPARRAKVFALYLEMIEDQDRLGEHHRGNGGKEGSG